MKNKLLASSAALLFLASFLFAPVRHVAAAVQQYGMAIINSTIDSTPIGATSPSTGSFTHLFTNSLGVNSVLGSYTGDSGGFLGWNNNSSGDMDFIATNGGSSPSFYWYYLLGSSLSAEMWLDTSAVLHVPSGISGNLTGNVTGNASGNAGTASALSGSPSQCPAGATGIAANGNAQCSTYKVIGSQFSSSNVSGGTWCTTAASANASCSNTINWPASFADSSYGLSCNAIAFSGAIVMIQLSNFTASTFQVTIYTGGDGAGIQASSLSQLSCIAVHD